MVVAYHVFPSAVPGGFAGVDVFFVISGYLITGHLWRGYAKTGKVDLADFWGRRARRLIPAAALVLLVTWIAARLVEPATQLADTARQVLASALYFQNWQLASDSLNYLKSDDAATPVQHFWSLSVEEQFYLVWPLLFLIAGAVAVVLSARRPGARRKEEDAVQRVRVRGVIVATLTTALVAASLAYSVRETNANASAAYFVTTTRMWELGVGGLLAIAPARLAGVLARQGWLGWAGLAAVVTSAFVLNGSMAFPGALALLPVLGSAALIAAGSAEARYGPAGVTSARFMVFIGGISYSLYLWHYPLVSLYSSWRGKAPGLVTGPVLIAAALVLSWLTRKYVEDPVRLMPFVARHKWRSLSVALAAVVPVALAAVYIGGEAPPWNGILGPNYPGAAALAGNAAHAAAPIMPPPNAISQSLYRTAGCLDDIPVSTPHECVFGDTRNPVLTVALVGDSAAGQWFDALQAIAGERHWRLVTELHSSCPWSSAVMLNSNNIGTFTSCHTWGAAVLHDLVTTIRPDVVLTTDYPAMGTVAHPAKESPAAIAEIGAGMAGYWKQLLAHGISVTGIKESPDVVEDVPTCVEEHASDLARCDVPRSMAILKTSPVTVAAALTGGKVHVADLNSLICGPKVCAPVVGNVLVFSDRHHLTWPYSETTAPFVEPLLAQANPLLARS
jgi:peptidoglycan/LPS O-acetylase OafA/YrhL